MGDIDDGVVDRALAVACCCLDSLAACVPVVASALSSVEARKGLGRCCRLDGACRTDTKARVPVDTDPSTTNHARTQRRCGRCVFLDGDDIANSGVAGCSCLDIE